MRGECRITVITDSLTLLPVCSVAVCTRLIDESVAASSVGMAVGARHAKKTKAESLQEHLSFLSR